MEIDIENAMQKIITTERRAETLTDQMNKVQTINRALHQRVAAERMRIQQSHDRRWMDVQHDYDQRMRDAINKLENERAVELRKLSDEYHEAKREIDKVAATLD